MALFKIEKKSVFGDDTKYSRNIQIPQYEPKNRKPFIEELYDNKKALKLIKEATEMHKDGKISADELALLRLSAYRHIVFHYDKIADYYAHASLEMQNLMEDSALVIVDIEDAIMNGYVEATDRITEIIEGAKKPNEG